MISCSAWPQGKMIYLSLFPHNINKIGLESILVVFFNANRIVLACEQLPSQYEVLCEQIVFQRL